MDREQIVTLCQRHQAILLDCNEQVLRIAVAGEASPELMTALRFTSHRRIDIEYWDPARMSQHQQTRQRAWLPGVSDDGGGVVEHINQILQQALLLRASDIHFEPAGSSMRIRLRVDGVLQMLSPVAENAIAPLTARLKVLGSLDIAERRLPQDGQFSITLSGKTVSFRIATLPCRGGEKVVLRLLNQEQQALELAGLGMSPAQLAAFRLALYQPQGLMLVTGPTGSGKTVTLYSALHERNDEAINISSVEDPVEIPLAGICQTQINPRAGLTFQSVLRALLRQDPDVVMVGEIRDGETAEIALNAAQTGHLVLSTLHTNSTAESLVRLQQMGMARWMIASALQLIVAQRLVRKLCPHCRRKGVSGITLPATVWPAPLPHWQTPGCERCVQGYHGRLALFEVMTITDPIRQAITAGASVSDIEQCAIRAGMTTLLSAGCRAVTDGLTTLEELVRVLGLPHDGG